MEVGTRPWGEDCPGAGRGVGAWGRVCPVPSLYLRLLQLPGSYQSPRD